MRTPFVDEDNLSSVVAAATDTQGIDITSFGRTTERIERKLKEGAHVVVSCVAGKTEGFRGALTYWQIGEIAERFLAKQRQKVAEQPHHRKIRHYSQT